MARISFSLDGVGAADYVLPYNPIELYVPQAQLDGNSNSVQTIDGETITFYGYHDSRRGKMTWRGYPSDTTSLGTAFAAMLTELSGYVGNYRWMHFGDIGSAYGIYLDTGWSKIKVISLNRSLRSSGGTRFDAVELIWEDAEE